MNTYRFEVSFRKDGRDFTKIVEARHEFEAIQLAGAWGYNVVVFSVVNLDL